MHIYIFGSIVRGELDEFSDVDLILISDEHLEKIDSSKYSIYTTSRIKELFSEGNPFAWHLYYESVLVFGQDYDLLKTIGPPQKYTNCKNDLIKFKNLFEQSIASIKENNLSIVFDLAMVFLAIRNFATCYSLDKYKKPIFSRNSFEKLPDHPLTLDSEIKSLLMTARMSSTRGINIEINEELINKMFNELDLIVNWFDKILNEYENRI